jgi:hypothetical protein
MLKDWKTTEWKHLCKIANKRVEEAVGFIDAF